MNFHELKAMYLGIPVSRRMTDALKEFADVIEQEGLEQVLVRIVDLLGELTEFTGHLVKRMEPVALDPVRFTCNRCGRCCESFTIGVGREDIGRIIGGRRFRMLPFLTLCESRPTFQFWNKKMFRANDMVYPPELIRWIKELNPSLENIDPEDLSSCIFFDSTTKTCKVYDYRPAECRLYPVGNKLVGMTNLLCDPVCFEAGGQVDMAAFQNIFDENRPNEAAFAALYQLNPQGGWRLSAFKLALLFDRLAYAVIC
ncbi:MAG: YkgJ family cysteine cluster protein [Candidatus Lokiarchaeota archaeon]|nr:YkgJ family cysteine cluster protein [Candidatus Lokiarchaeota archaeon]